MEANSTSLTFYSGPIPGGSGLQGNYHVKTLDNKLPIGTCLGVFDGSNYVPLWDIGALDYENKDLVLAYTHSKDAPFGITGDMLRISRNRRWLFGPSVGSPELNDASYSFCCNPDTPTCMEFRPWYAPVAYDVKLTKWSNLLNEGAWLTFARAGDPHCFRIGMVGDGTDGKPWALAIYASQGEESSPDKPGRLIARLTEKGNLWVRGKITAKS